jgi:threonine/homoserine/homoserine lactone efflux protein
MHIILNGVQIGLLIGLILGPIAVLCIRRSMSDGFLMGVATGLGASGAHIIFGSIAAFGLTAIKNLLISYGAWLKLAGGIYLLYLAYKAATKTISAEEEYQAMPYSQALISTFLLNMTNPVVITSYAAFLTMFNVSIAGAREGIQLLLGIFLGNFSVWVGLSALCVYLRTRNSEYSEQIVSWVNKGAAVILTIFGTVGVATSFYTFLS